MLLAPPAAVRCWPPISVVVALLLLWTTSSSCCCDGLRVVPVAQQQQQEDTDAGVDIWVLICTQSFTAEDLVEEYLLDALANDGDGWRVRYSLVDEAGIDWAAAAAAANEQQQQPQGDKNDATAMITFRSLARVVLVVASTYADGDPPNHAAEFAHWLGSIAEEEEPQDAQHQQPQQPQQYYAVFGLGDRTYPAYCAFAEFVDAALERHKRAMRLLPLHTGDAATGDQSGAFARWLHELRRVLPSVVLGNDSESSTSAADTEQAVTANKKRKSHHQRQRPFRSTGGDYRRSAIPPHSVTATLVSKTELLRPPLEEEKTTINDDSNSNSNDDDHHRSVLHIELSVPPATTAVQQQQQQQPPAALLFASLQPGDYVGIHPRNDPALVRRALEWLGVAPDAPVPVLVTVPSYKKTTDGTVVQITAQEFLTAHVDLAGRAAPSTLRALVPFAGTLELRALARRWTRVEHLLRNDNHNHTTSTENENENANDENDETTTTTSSTMEQWIAGRHVTKLDLAVQFQCRPSLQALARAVGPLQPRLYSVATVRPAATTTTTTTTNKNNNTTHNNNNNNNTTTNNATDGMTIGLCVAIVPGGLCTDQYLSRLEPGSPVTIFARPTDFHWDGATVNDDHDDNDDDDDGGDTSPATTLLIAAGSGIGPYMGMLENVAATKKQRQSAAAAVSASSSSPAGRLWVGCRTPAEILYRDQLAAWEQQGVVQLKFAYSRIFGHPRRHVQDLLQTEEQASVLWKEVFVDGGRVLVCGRLEICTGVRQALIGIAQTQGGLSETDAHGAVQELEKQGRLLNDCWSVPPTPKLEDETDLSHRLVDDFLESQLPNRRTESALENEVDISTIPAWPSYLRLVASGEFERRLEQATNMTSSCVACGRFCEVNRLSHDSNDWGECRVGQQAIVSDAAPHFGEEDCLKGTMGSGTIFFSACNLKCVYCQNWKISTEDRGWEQSDERLADLMIMLQEKGCHNINLVSPTHNVLAILRAILIAARKGLRLPIVWNTGGYDSVASLRLLDGIVDIYLPDSKYASRTVARKLSKVDNYPEINQAAIKEMYRQVGDLQIDPRTGLAYRGVLVRHLVLPNELAGTSDVATFLVNEVSPNTYANVLPYYRPEHEAASDQKFGLARKPTTLELLQAHQAARSARLQRLHDEDKLCGGPHTAECLPME